MASTRIKDINNTINGSTLAGNTDLCYFVVDLDNGLTYNINRTLLIDFIKTKGISDGTFGSACTLDYGNDVNDVPYFITNDTAQGVMVHIASGGVITYAQNSAFNKAYAGSGTQSTTARSDHTHPLLSTITNEYNSHTATFDFTGVTASTITLDMLLALMKYTPTKAINPAVLYRLYTYDTGVLTPIQSGTYNDLVVTALSLTTTPGNWYKFSLLNFTSLNITKKYLLVVNFVDDRGYFIPSGGA